MITLVQRVQNASVVVDNTVVAAIGRGLLLFVGVEKGDEERDALVTATKISGLRIFEGPKPMDKTVADVAGEILVVSQFTLAGRIYKGNRPSFDNAEVPQRAEALYESVANHLAKAGISVARGKFAADMQVSLVNDGPVTFVVSVKNGSLVKAP